MRGYNSGFCSYCNCSSCDCSCGRKTVLQQSVTSCCNTSAGTRFCKEPLAFLTDNFTILGAGVEVEVKVSNSSKLYEGEGIQIGDGYFQIVSITDSTTIVITHNGTATPNLAVTAINAAYGCYNYPIYYVGIVELDYAVDTDNIEGLDGSFEVIDDSIVDPVISYTYGYLGPYKIQFNLELTLTTANTPFFISIPLPNASAEPSAAFSSVITVVGDAPYKSVCYKDGTNLIVGFGEGTSLPNDNIVIQASGEYGV